jgi:hypothetical protein
LLSFLGLLADFLERILGRGLFSNSSNRGLSLSEPTPIDTRKVSRFVDASGESLKQTNYRKLAGGADLGLRPL